ncbi:cytochrome c oxidase, cbb3-type, subunit II [Sulfuricurvum kujiense DSM 16994]|uniref:Cytochrome c oxidase, cbb3-type, subunit II n=1 Tax=Sulfuricurvum kujiense (strain ATCC BAA-921 / DSM 16994 / JCM 11577 / YK-1) TaxID=709032 RepID=E4TXS3_SULKY|nr:cytochrome-c oxidase, cbb3-type subunit II [Sulfuricurvum kujiense]ADR35009.1 cytochrome c oxidase, cbb3-type, subunit II [Sulfuricurvum kujiense DSM 16994]
MFHWLEKHPFFFAVAVFVTIAFAGLIEILPNFAQASQPVVGTKPYTTLELAGRHVYIKNSCNACHSQLIRPFKSETDRYGHYSLSGEYAYDRPFLWGSKRTGPDLMRVGNYRTTDWHENHMKDPAAVVPGSIMPAYPWMFKNTADIDTAYAEQVTVNKVFAVPYNAEIPMADGSKTTVALAATLDEAKTSALEEAKVVAADMKDQEVKDAVAAGQIPEIVALIAYLNSLK